MFTLVYSASKKVVLEVVTRKDMYSLTLTLKF